MSEKLLQEYMKLRTETGHAYVRWLTLISAGVFPLAFNILLNGQVHPESLFPLKIALTLNIIAIVLGSMVAYGETMLAHMAVNLLIDRQIAKTSSDTQSVRSLPPGVVLPWYMRFAERGFYICVVFYVALWAYLIWTIK